MRFYRSTLLRGLAVSVSALVMNGLALPAFAKEPTATVGLVEKAPEGVRAVKTDRGFMIPYTVKMSDAVSFEMVPIPGGKIKVGSPSSEKGRNEDEGPQVEVEVAPFWMAKCEVSWAEYKLYMTTIELFITPDGVRAEAVNDKNKADAVTAPSKLYEPTYTFEYGEDPQLPAVTMSQFAARQYTKWLSKKSPEGLVYRLPNEAEWNMPAALGQRPRIRSATIRRS